MVEKKPVRVSGRAFYRYSVVLYTVSLGALNIRGLLAFWTLGYFESNFLAFLQGFKTTHLDR